MVSTAKPVFIDANVVIEILLNRQRRRECQKMLSDPATVYYFSTLSVHLTYHFCELDNIDPRLTNTLIGQLNILPVNPSHVSLAQSRYNGKEFEDCLQAACAELNDCDEIVTLDKTFAKISDTKLPVYVIR